ncbi:MAG: hypothetical protein K1X71_09265 [Pirellulales bacterium]|nr:hypothetical protein [Pirellulales bacterium]
MPHPASLIAEVASIAQYTKHNSAHIANKIGARKGIGPGQRRVTRKADVTTVAEIPIAMIAQISFKSNSDIATTQMSGKTISSDKTATPIAAGSALATTMSAAAITAERAVGRTPRAACGVQARSIAMHAGMTIARKVIVAARVSLPNQRKRPKVAPNNTTSQKSPRRLICGRRKETCSTRHPRTASVFVIQSTAPVWASIPPGNDAAGR